ncbi:MAG: S8 family peptidase, partial [Pseudomonadota bacterium]
PENLIGKSQDAQSDNSQLDPLISQDWGLTSIGLFDAFTPLLQPLKAGISSCSKNVTVAVVDTGIDYSHSELRDNLWVNSGEVGAWNPPPQLGSQTSCRDKSCNGIDDDGNGFVDDLIGWDFVNDVPLPYDTHGHGSHIAGIIGATAANGFGLAGVCPRVRIMALKYYDSSGSGFNNLQNTVKAFHYANKMGAHIINYSGGGAEAASAERLALEDSRDRGILIVAAAGNDGRSNDLIPYYPASYPLDNIVSVASINRQDQLLPSSNFGKIVHVAAPGLSVLSTLPGGRFGMMTGTSQATAFVTGAAALLASQFKDMKEFDYHAIKNWILKGARPMPDNQPANTLVSNGIISISGSLKQVKGWTTQKGTPSLALESIKKRNRN